MNFGKVIEDVIEIRTKKKLSQEYISMKSGLTQQQISRMENGKSIPRIDTFIAYAQAIGVKMIIVEDRK